MSKKAYVDELKATFVQKGCSLCRLVDESARKLEAISGTLPQNRSNKTSTTQ